MPEKSSRDPRDALVQDKYYTHLPDPLLDWLIRARLPESAKWVFLAHWRAGQINRDWCSEIPIKTLAAQCHLDVSTVTRAYQLLARRGLIRRQDPGRDPSRPFQQAVAVTEVRLPKDLLRALDQYANRRQRESVRAVPADPQSSSTEHPDEPSAPTPSPPSDPFVGLSLRERTHTLNRLLDRMSDVERTRYHQAVRQSEPTLAFDSDSRVPPEDQETVRLLLARMAHATPKIPAAQTPIPDLSPSTVAPRQLTHQELARLRRDLQAASGTLEVSERFREVVWSVEQGALSRFSPTHATRIALKKIREGAWTRPNRMPPKWALALTRSSGISAPAAPAPDSQRGGGFPPRTSPRILLPQPVSPSPATQAPSRTASPRSVASFLRELSPKLPHQSAVPETCRLA